VTKASVARQKLHVVLRDKSKFDMTKAVFGLTKDNFCLGFGDKSLLFSLSFVFNAYFYPWSSMLDLLLTFRYLFYALLA